MTLQELELKNKLTRQRREREARGAAAAAVAATKSAPKAEDGKKGQRRGKKPPQREFLVVEPSAEDKQDNAVVEATVETAVEIENPGIVE